MKKGTFIGVGVGPGDPELLTLKAACLIEQSPVVAYLESDGGSAQARDIARLAMEKRSADAQDIIVTMPMCMDRNIANQAYDQGAKDIAEALAKGHDVAFLCEGDPLFFGSFTYLMERLSEDFECQVVPGISSINAASAVLKEPLTLLKESFSVMSGRHSAEQLEDALLKHDSVVIMKAGSTRPRILAALEKTGRMQDAKYLEYIGRENEFILHNVAELEAQAGPYFSLFVVTRQTREHHSE